MSDLQHNRIVDLEIELTQAAARIAELEADDEAPYERGWHAGQQAASDTLSAASKRIAELEAEVARLTQSRDAPALEDSAEEAAQWLANARRGAADFRAAHEDLAAHLPEGMETMLQEARAEVARLTAALATMEEASVRNGVALQREAREAMREACVQIADSHGRSSIASAIRALDIPSPPAEERTP